MKILPLESTLTDKLAERNYRYRNTYFNIFKEKYLKLLSKIISYKHDEHFILNSYEIEKMLRLSGRAAIGRCSDGVFRLLGRVNSNTVLDNEYTYTPPRTEADIDFILPPNLLEDAYLEMTTFNSGNFIVINNEDFNNNIKNDIELIELHSLNAAELQLSRYSIIQQAKFNTVFKDDIDSEDINEIVKDFYNGSPVVKGSKLFDFDINVSNIGNPSIISALKDLKNEYNSNINDLNSFLGLNTSGMVKESGVSSSEVNSNNDFLFANLFTYLDSRNEKLELIEKYHGYICRAYPTALGEKALFFKDRYMKEVD